MSIFCKEKPFHAIPIEIIETSQYQNWFEQQTETIQSLTVSQSVTGKAGQFLRQFNVTGQVEKLFLFIDKESLANSVGHLSQALPPFEYKFQNISDSDLLFHILKFIAMGSYSLDQFKQSSSAGKKAQFFVPDLIDKAELQTMIDSIFMVRDLVNFPTNHLGPTEFEEKIREVGKQYSAKITVFKGKQLLTDFPLVHAVGRAADDEPRLVELTWGKKGNPKLSLVGKGVCFDTGGIDLKSSGQMLYMKKDMGGAAHILALANLIMAHDLPIDLQVLLPLVENSVSGSAFLPLDIYKSRKGLTVEIGNTDAEGRLLLADALTYADETNPDLIIDFATLTGAARVAVGYEIHPYFSTNKQIATEIAEAGERNHETVWELPLHKPYLRYHKTSNLSDLMNTAQVPQGGAISTAMFMKEFISEDRNWVHFDINAFNYSSQPAYPKGGEANALETVFDYLKTSFLK